MHSLSRRFFIGGLASAFALGPRRIFAAAPGAFSTGAPDLVFGVLSDIHIGLAKGGASLHPTYDTSTFVKALEWFREQGVDAVVIAGDMAHHGVAGELKAVADAWYGVFPGDKAPDGRRVERAFVFGNHDWGGKSRGKKVYSTGKDLKANVISVDPKRWWGEIFHEDWSPFFVKEVKGFPFVCAHWCIGDCHGKDEAFTKGMKEFYDSLKKPFDPAKPFFHVQHPHPKGTVHGATVWGQDNGMAPSVLSAHPNAIAFSGHSHTSLTDERSIWQGAFTSVGCGTLRNVSPNFPGALSPVPEGYENYKTPKGRAADDAVKALGNVGLMNCRQGQIVRVYGDRVVFSRREFVTGVPLGDDLVMPLPAAEKRPFEFSGRLAKAKPPAFAVGAKLAAKVVKGALRDSRRGKVPVWEIEIPAATAELSARAAELEIVASGPDGFSKRFVMVNPSARFPASDPRASEPTAFRVACERLPAGEIKFSVVAASCWGKRSQPLETTVKNERKV